jgi:Ca-activated chloride channel family protein
MSKLLSLFVFGFFAYQVLSTDEVKPVAKVISGTVFSNSSRQPLQHVKISCKGADSTRSTLTDLYGYYEISITYTPVVLSFELAGFIPQEVTVGKETTLDVWLNDFKGQANQVDTRNGLTELLRSGSPHTKSNASKAPSQLNNMSPPAIISLEEAPEAEAVYFSTSTAYEMPQDYAPPVYNTEEYATVHENGFVEPVKNPLSTFSIDVDAASYSNVRRFLNNGQTPPKDAVRVEEMINYFTYDYPQPIGGVPFAVSTELSQCPWEPTHELLHIGLQGKNIPTENLPPSNLVFLVDVSGSMNDPEKLPLLKSAFHMLTEQLRAADRVAIVVYAGAAGLVLPSTPGNHKQEILAAIDQLAAGGSTAGGEGIQLAYQIARQNFRKEGNNRVILATDGDFNIGASSDAEMERLIEKERESNIFLTILGFGMGNYKDSKMETLADKGNGNYAYIDNILEAKKVLVNEFGGTLFTIAKDVKLQIEFNPAKVKGYRLIGYENRALKSEDFNNDKKDAGELGSGHTVTALYEIIPVNQELKNGVLGLVDELKYQKNQVNPKAAQSNEWLTLKLRYKKPDGEKSQLITTTVMGDAKTLSQTSNNFRFASAVAAYGMLLRDSEFKGQATYAEVLRLAEGARGSDTEGCRIEFISLVKSSRLLVARK